MAIAVYPANQFFPPESRYPMGDLIGQKAIVLGVEGS
jgi:hypothetical protein